MCCLPVKPVAAAAGGAPNEDPPSGEVACDGADDPKDANVGVGAVVLDDCPPNPPNVKPLDGVDGFGEVPKPEKLLPNAGLAPNPVVLVGELREGLAPKPLAVAAGAGAPLNPPNTLPPVGGVWDVKPPPKGDVTVALLPNPAPNAPVLEADVVVEVPNTPAVGTEGVAAVPNGLGAEVVVLPNIPVVIVDVAGGPPKGLVGAVGEPPNMLLVEVEVGVGPPNGLEGAVDGPPNMLPVGAEVAVGPPNGLEVEVASAPNIPVMDAAVVVVGVPNDCAVEAGTETNPLPNGAGTVDIRAVLAPKIGPVVVCVVVGVATDAVDAAPNGMVAITDDGFSGELLSVGFAPNELVPVDSTVLVVGEVPCTDVVAVDESGAAANDG